MKLCLCEIMGGKAHKMIIQYLLRLKKVGNVLPQSAVTWSLRSFLRMAMTRPVSR